MVSHWIGSLLIGNESVVLFIDLIEFKVFYVGLKGKVVRGIVNYDSFVVAVVLHKDGIQIVLSSKLCVVVIARHNNAER